MSVRTVIGRHKLAGLHDEFRSAATFLVDTAINYIPVTITSGTRTMDEQARLHRELTARAAREGRPYPVARPGYSAHNYGLAIDVMGGDRFDSDEHRWLIELGKAIGMTTVKNDPPHLEHPAWRAILQQLLRRQRD